ncbi:MAG: hypothetical protein RJA22_520 [Verrucomicrobiota bacterium]|jgi:hypothetical protein
MKRAMLAARGWRRGAAWGLAAGALVVLAGCLVIPVDYHTRGSRRNVTAATTNLWRVGVTTREEVLLTLGEPDFVSEDGRRFGHAWSKVKAIVMGGYSGSEVWRYYRVETTFDASNRVAGVRFVSGLNAALDPGVEASSGR